MTIKIGTIQEMTGNGYEILVDNETRSLVLARFFNGNLVQDGSAEARSLNPERTLAL
jgi:hypothetical protein